MFLIRRVVGSSMQPYLFAGQIVILLKRRRFRAGQIVCATVGKRQVIKRLDWISSSRAGLVGINPRSGSYTVNLCSLKAVLWIRF